MRDVSTTALRAALAMFFVEFFSALAAERHDSSQSEGDSVAVVLFNGGLQNAVVTCARSALAK